jgi:hypothetical protein
VNTPEEFFAAIAGLLAASGIPYMVTGSVASSAFGHARSTNDFDVIVDPSAESLGRFLNSLPKDWYVSKPAALEALARRSMFNVISTDGGWKADLIVRGKRPFDIEEFNRRVVHPVLGIDAMVITPEDSILSKLDWSRDTQSPRQFDDAVGVAAMNLGTLDFTYLRKWGAELGLESRVEEVLQNARKGAPPAG